MTEPKTSKDAAVDEPQPGDGPSASMNLTRLGHYFTPQSGEGSEELLGTCETALVVAVQENTEGETATLAVWSINGIQDARLFIQIADPSWERNSFHLSLDCPWHR